MTTIFSQTDIIPDHPSSSSPRPKYEVFLSFRGEDTRDNFAYYLYSAFLEKGIHTFRDDEILGGKQVMTELMEAIEESKYSVIVISQNYASLSWCLNELVRILDCSKTLGHAVYAVFYHVDPSNVRKQTGKFGEGFSEAVFKNQMSAQRWKEALVKIVGLKGWVYPSPGYGAELQFIDALVEDIFGKLKDTYLNPLEGLVGMTSRMDKVINLLDLGSDEARMVGIWGMGGIGKTTIAKAVYQSISWKFEGCCFIEDVREVANGSGLKALQEQLISTILKRKNFKVESVMSGANIIRTRICHRKVLIVLDDVDESTELENLIGKLDWFSNSSKIIITTRNQRMLTLLGVKDVYEGQELNMDESKELFISKAFAENREIGEFRWLIDRAIEFSQGNPLALKVLGSSLLNLTVQQWKSALNILKESPGDKVQQVLRISYDGLNGKEKDIFLDICCFFRGKDKDEVINFLGACEFNPDIGISILIEKSLLTISENNTMGMHDLVQKMGWTIVESTKERGNRSRLWHHSDIKHVLTENTGTKKIEGIYDKSFALGAKDLKLVPNAFEKMKNLRLLRIHSTSSCMYLPNMLRYLHWRCYPSKCLPATFQPEHLVELHLTHGCIEQIWDDKMVLPKLTVLDLSDSTCLTKSPEFKSFPNLETLCLVGCTALQNLHPSVEELEKLIILNLEGCSSLTKIVQRFEDLKQLEKLYADGTSITELPQSIGNATNLCYLDFSRCKKLKRIPRSIGQLKKLKKLLLAHCSSLNELPKEVGFIESLEILNVDYSGIRQLPSSVGHLWNLQFLSLRGCKGFPSTSWSYWFYSILLSKWASNCMTLKLPSLSGFTSLKSLDLNSCNLKYIPESVFCCLSLKELWLPNNDFRNLPASIMGLSKLEVLCIGDCKKLQKLPEIPSNLRYLIAYGCKSLKTIRSISLFKDADYICFSKCSKLVDNEEIKSLLEIKFLFNQIKVNNYNRLYTCPGSKIPKWFTQENDGGLLKVQVPPLNSCQSNLMGFAFAVIVSTKSKCCPICVHIRVGDKIFDNYELFLCESYTEDISILYIPRYRLGVDVYHPGGVDLEVCFGMPYYQSRGSSSIVNGNWEEATEVKSCGVRLIYEDDLRSFGENDKAEDNLRSLKTDIDEDDLCSFGKKDKATIATSHLILVVCLFIFSIYVSRYISLISV